MTNLVNFILCFYTLMPKNHYKDYRNMARIYLDEYPEQEEIRKRFFAIKWNLKNSQLKKIA